VPTAKHIKSLLLEKSPDSLKEEDMNSIFIVLTLIQTISTIFIARATWLNYRIYETLQKKDEDYKKQTSDLYQAIVISTLLSGPSSYGQYGQTKDVFKKEYRGETKIFQD